MKTSPFMKAKTEAINRGFSFSFQTTFIYSHQGEEALSKIIASLFIHLNLSSFTSVAQLAF